ncbi:MAG: DUF3047 domain-containing protein, partial [Anaerolineae bacterium]|nr:DUF3047 domain-containing protein [Anaerolineae bacterium]
VTIGNTAFQLRSVVSSEPDKLSVNVGLGPRFLTSEAALRATGLLLPGSLVRWNYRVKLPDNAADDRAAAAFIADARAASPEAGWQPYVLPGKRATQYRFTTKEGRWAIEARADGSASMLRRTVDMPAETLAEMGWSWWVDAPLAQADLADIDRTDAPASIVLAFDGDKSRLPAR